MRSAYYSDLCSKFMIENTILKMEYAEVRVFSISDKVSLGLFKNITSMCVCVCALNMSNLNHRLNTTSAIKGRPTNSLFSTRLLKQSLTTLCHLDQLLLVTHINLSSNQLQRLPPHFAMLQCLEVTRSHPFIRPLRREVSLDKRTKISASSLSATCPK